MKQRMRVVIHQIEIGVDVFRSENPLGQVRFEDFPQVFRLLKPAPLSRGQFQFRHPLGDEVHMSKIEAFKVGEKGLQLLKLLRGNIGKIQADDLF